MSQLSTYRTILSEELGTSETVYLTQTKRDRAVNQACRWIGNNYQVPELLLQQNVTFTTGLASIPSRYHKKGHIKAYDSSDTIFEFLTPNNFDTAGRGITIDYNITAAARRIHVVPTTTTTLTFRYYQKP